MVLMTKDRWITYYCGITVGNTNPILTRYLKKITGVGTTNQFDAKDGVRKIRHAWDVRRREDIRAILSAVRPHLLLKRKQAELILSLPATFRHVPLQRERVYLALRKLNKKGII